MWRDQDPNWPGTSRWYREASRYYYAFFGRKLPDLNLTQPALASELENIARFWILRGVDGFRLDAVRYLVEGPRGEADTAETHDWIRRFAAAVKVVDPKAMLVGEVWEWVDAIAPYVNRGDELDFAFHFPFSGGVLTSLSNGQAWALGDALRQSALKVPDPSALAPFVANHDRVRVASQLSGRLGGGASAAVGVDDARLKLAAAALLSQPGTPYLYYGEEIGMGNSQRGLTVRAADLEKRTPMQWTRGGHHGFTLDSVAPWNVFRATILL